MNGLEALPFLREKGHVVSLVGGGDTGGRFCAFTE